MRTERVAVPNQRGGRRQMPEAMWEPGAQKDLMRMWGTDIWCLVRMMHQWNPSGQA